MKSCETAGQSIEIALLGGFGVRRPSGQPVELRGRKDRALLAFLAVAPGVPWSRERLAGLLWGASGERQARDSLKQAVLRLRRALGPAASCPVVAQRQSVTLHPGGVTVDARLFERLVAEATADSLERAVALYRGDLLDGLSIRDAEFDDWLMVERQRLRQLAVEASSGLMTRRLAEGRRDRAASAALRLLTLEPLHELACRTLMQVHADRGERAQAMKLFETLRDRLRRELGVAPEPDTVRLQQSIRGRREWPAAVGPVPPDGPGAETSARPSVAVLPFTTIGGDPEQDGFADGLTEDIITDLSRISGLFVAARNSAFAFKGSAVPPREVATVLDVRHILEGSVRKAGGQVRVTAQLVDAAGGGHLWANRYDRSLDDIFALQDEITSSIVAALKITLLPGDVESLGVHATDNPEAYQYYVAARSFYLRGIDTHSLRIARDMFARAVELDPQYARAYAGIGICESYLSMRNPDATFASSFRHALRALELDPYLAEAHAVKGLALYADGRYQEATPAFERALVLDAELFETHFFYARNCRLQGLHEQAVALFRRAAALRPSDFRSLGLLAESLKALGRGDEILVAARQCLERIEAEVAAHPDNAGALAFGSAVLAELGQPKRAEDWATRAIMIAPDDYLARYNAARTYALLGKSDAAMDRLEAAFSASAVWQRRLALWMRSDADIDPLRDHPRFRALLRRLPEL